MEIRVACARSSTYVVLPSYRILLFSSVSIFEEIVVAKVVDIDDDDDDDGLERGERTYNDKALCNHCE